MLLSFHRLSARCLDRFGFLKSYMRLSVKLEKGINYLMGIIIDEDNYNQRYRAKLPTPTNPNFYNESTPNNATNVVRSKDEAVHTAKIVDYLLFAAAK